MNDKTRRTAILPVLAAALAFVATTASAESAYSAYSASLSEFAAVPELLGNDQLPTSATLFPFDDVLRSVAGYPTPPAVTVAGDWPSSPVQRRVRNRSVPPR